MTLVEYRKDPDIKSSYYNYLSFLKDAKNIHWRKYCLMSKWCWKTCIIYM